MNLSIAMGVGAALICFTSPLAADEIKDCEVCPVLVVVPAGEFIMGSEAKESTYPDEKPLHSVTISKPFAVGKF